MYHLGLINLGGRGPSIFWRSQWDAQTEVNTCKLRSDYPGQENEAHFVDRTVNAVGAQTARTIKWVIVSDSSTDGTDDIASIELVWMPEPRERQFSGKVHPLSAGYDRVKHLDYDVNGRLDGGISFDPELRLSKS